MEFTLLYLCQSFGECSFNNIIQVIIIQQNYSGSVSIRNDTLTTSSTKYPAGSKSKEGLRCVGLPVVTEMRSVELQRHCSFAPLIKGDSSHVPAHPSEKLHHLLRDAGVPSHSSLASPELSSEHR